MSLILTCPECATRYAASAESFEPPGRNVRCSRCEHTWFQEINEPEAYETLFEDFEPEPESEPEIEFQIEPDPEPHLEPHSEQENETWAEPENHAAMTSDLIGEMPRAAPRARADSRAGLETNFARRPSLPISDTLPIPDTPSRGTKLVSGLIALLVTIAILGALAACGWYFRPRIIALIPQTEALYALLPAPEVESDYDLRNTGYVEGTEEGNHVLIVSGEVVNQTDRPLVVPVVQVTVSTIDGRTLDQWSFKPRGETIEPGKARYFETRRLNPPEGGQKMRIVILED